MNLIMRYRRLGFIAALPLLCLLSGCGASLARYTPTTDEARTSLETALTAWRDGKPYGPVRRRRPSRLPTRPGRLASVVESFEIGEEKDEGDGTKQFTVALKMKKPPGDQSVRYFVHGRDPVWVYREEDYKRMINMDNNPEPASEREVQSSANRQAAMTRPLTWFRTRRPCRLAGAGPIWRRAWAALKLAQVRLRIPIVLVVAALVVGRWEVDRNYWDRLTRGTLSESIALHAVSADTEYFCPMDPGVLSDWPGKCGICNMALVRRKKGEAVVLPDGVMARMQLSPYRIQLAGIQTAPARFQPLVQDVESSGVVTASGGPCIRAYRDTRAAGTLDRPGPDRGHRLRRPRRPRPDRGTGPRPSSAVRPTAGNISAPRSR